MTDEKETLDKLLTDIEKKMGAYSRDQLRHADNVITSASENAKKIRTILIERVKQLITTIGNHVWCDVERELYEFLKELGVKVTKDGQGDYSLEETK